MHRSHIRHSSIVCFSKRIEYFFTEITLFFGGKMVRIAYQLYGSFYLLAYTALMGIIPQNKSGFILLGTFATISTQVRNNVHCPGFLQEMRRKQLGALLSFYYDIKCVFHCRESQASFRKNFRVSQINSGLKKEF